MKSAIETERQKRYRYDDQLSPRDAMRVRRFNACALVSLAIVVLSGVSLMVIPGVATIVMLAALSLAVYFDARSVFIQRYAYISGGWYLFDSTAKIFGYLLCLGSVVLLGTAVFLLTVFL